MPEPSRLLGGENVAIVCAARYSVRRRGRRVAFTKKIVKKREYKKEARPLGGIGGIQGKTGIQTTIKGM